MQIRDTRNGEWYWVNNAVLSDPHLTAHQKVVYSAICTFAGFDEIHPDFELISKRTGGTVSVRACKTAISKLREVGYIKTDVGGGRGRANVYYLLKATKGCNHCTVSERVQMEAIKGANGSMETVQPLHTNKIYEKDIDKDIYKTQNVLGNTKELIFLFKEINPSYELLYKRKNQHDALKRLISKFGREKIENTIKALPRIITQRFAPRITTPLQLEARLGDLIAFTRQEKGQSKVIKI